MKNIRLLVCAVFLLSLVSVAPVSAQSITAFENTIIDYQLPYPGILPDNPLFFLKQTRDSIQLFLAQDPLAKAEVFLQLSDKSLSAALELSKKGKHKLTIERVAKSEELFAKAIEIVEKQGSKMDAAKKTDFLAVLKKANLKHRETIDELMKDLPQGQFEQIQKLRETNVALEGRISTIK